MCVFSSKTFFVISGSESVAFFVSTLPPDGMSSKLSSQYGQASQMFKDLWNYVKQLGDIEDELAEVNQEYGVVKDMIAKFNKVNEMWSKNFKIMQVTFKEIRRNVAFNVQPSRTLT